MKNVISNGGLSKYCRVVANVDRVNLVPRLLIVEATAVIFSVVGKSSGDM